MPLVRLQGPLNKKLYMIKVFEKLQKIKKAVSFKKSFFFSF